MNWSDIESCGIAIEKGAASLKCLEAVFANILTSVTLLAGMALFVMLLWGGFRYLTSGGDPKAAEAARGTMTYALMGMVLIGVAFLIFKLIESFTGVSILTFTIPD
ncbi:hypothetical protein HYW54_02525 [Candidatus Gottesmanbacteria bacterium]|nr:hypothetical protein [Candidatus Gottesmanbacteria bacterium]